LNKYSIFLIAAKVDVMIVEPQPDWSIP